MTKSRIGALGIGMVAFGLSAAVACREQPSEHAVDVASPESPRVQPEARARFLGIEGRTNATPYLAARDNMVAAVWSAVGEEGTDLFLATSRDGGRSFLEPVRVNDVDGDVSVYGEQPPRVALGGAGASDEPHVYVTWTSRNSATELSFLRFARSLDGGKSFESAVSLHEPGLKGARGWHSLSVDPAGNVHALWLDARPLAGHALNLTPVERIWAQIQPSAYAHSSATAMGLYHLAWDGASPPAATRLFEPVCECCKTTMTVGPDGAIYAAWRHIYPGSNRDIAFSLSRDGGTSFSDAVRVSEDDWNIDACPDDGPAMVVDDHNRVHIVWPTIVVEETDIGIFYASSAEGTSFSPKKRLRAFGGTDPSHPQLILDSEGALAVVWDELVEGRRRIVMTRARANEGDVSWYEPELVDLANAEEASSYPVAAATGDGVLVAWTAQTGEESVIRLRRVETLGGP